MIAIRYKSLQDNIDYLVRTRARYGYRWPDEQIARLAPYNFRHSLTQVDLPDVEVEECFGGLLLATEPVC